MLQKERPCIKSQGVKTFEQNEDVYIFLVLPKYHIFFPFSTALQKLLTCATEDSSRRQIKLNLPRFSNSKSSHTPSILMHVFPSGASVSV